MTPGQRLAFYFLGGALLLMLLSTLGRAQEGIVINGKALDDREKQIVRQLESYFKAKAMPGRYWYDARTGLFGREGKGAIGASLPGLKLGGPLQANASRGNTGVLVNGRELHRDEVRFLSRCTVVQKGRFWMDAQGNGGYEGGPPLFNVVKLCSEAQQRSRLPGTPGNRGWYGSVSGGGGMVGAVFSDGTGVTCGPDGGCVF